MSISALELAVLYQKKRDERLAMDKQAAKLAEEEAALKNQVFDALHAANINSVGNSKHVFAIVTKMEPQVEDWPALYAHIKQTGHFELLFRRINAAAVKERWENTVLVPGVAAFPVEKLSITKAKE